MITCNRMQLFDIYSGDIFRVKVNGRYIMHDSGISAALFKCIDSMQSNNGNFRAVDDAGRLHWFNTVTDDIQMFRRTKEVHDNRQLFDIVPAKPADKTKVTISNPVRFHATWDELDRAEDRCLPNDTDF